MEADVNVLVVGGSAARRGAIGRHFPQPLIRRSPQKPLSPRKGQRGRRPGAASRAGRGACTLQGWEGGTHSPFSLLIWRVKARRANGPGAPGADARLHQHGGHTRSPPFRPPRGPKESG